MATRLLGYVLVIVAILTAGVVIFRNSHKGDVPLVFAPTQLLGSTWLAYKNEYVEKGTYRTIDKQRDNITTSEGQSYTMLRAVWMGDKEYFDGAWKWVQENIEHRDDHLFAWLWGKQNGNSYGVLTDKGGNTTASDADSDIALALIFAYARWQDPEYLTQARAILNDIWEKEVFVVNGVPYLAANNFEKNSSSSSAIVNPSYFSPASYRIFAQVDTTHNWKALADSSYVVLQKSIALPLNKTMSAHLPPDWVSMNKKTGALTAAPGDLTTNFSYDALRIPFRIALDATWFNEPRAVALLKSLDFLSIEWQQGKSIHSSYAHDGTVLESGEVPAMYGGVVGYFKTLQLKEAEELYTTKLAFLFDASTGQWKEKLSYYDDNWAWFGIALYNDLLPNLAADLPAGAFNTLVP